jgi:hypothetical protein
MIDANQIDNCICSVSSHNNAAEKQFRYPVEYGGPKPKTTTFTTTGGASAYLTSEKKVFVLTLELLGLFKILVLKMHIIWEQLWLLPVLILSIDI